MTPDELDALLEDVQPEDVLEYPGAVVHLGDCLDVLRAMPDESVDAIVTDPPYGLAELRPAVVADALQAWGSGDRERVPDARGFMGHRWDAFVPPPAVWDECLRVLKPGGHLVAFAGARTHDLMGLSIRLAGFEIRDGLAWLYASGFPKGPNLDEAMADHLAGNTATPDRLHPRIREVTAYLKAARDAAGWTNSRINALFGRKGMASHWTTAGTQPACPSLAEWAKLKEVLAPHLGDDLDELVQEVAATNRPDDWGQRESDHFLETLGSRKGPADERDWSTSLKPAFEPVTLARKPLARVPGRALSVQVNVRMHGTGGLNIGANRTDEGRWPANVVMDELQAGELGAPSRWFFCPKPGRDERPAYWTPTCNCETVKPCQEQSPQRDTAGSSTADATAWSTTSSGKSTTAPSPTASTSTTETATSSTTGSRTFSSSLDSNTSGSTPGVSSATGSGGSPAGSAGSTSQSSPNTGTSAPKAGPSTGGAALAMSRMSSKPRSCAVCGADWKKNVHSTVKPLALMRWLVRLVTPPGGVVLDPFSGSGSTLEAAVLEGFDVVGVEREPRYLPLIEQRLERATVDPEEDLLGVADDAPGA